MLNSSGFKIKSWPFLIMATLIFLIFILAIWWLYLIVKLGTTLNALPIKTDISINFLTMVKWEGSIFFLLLLSVTLTILFMYLQSLKRSHMLTSFFASLTHELKTPLASIHLQSEVLSEVLKNTLDPQDTKTTSTAQILMERLFDDTQKLETQLDKILQLSRLEKGGVLNLTSLDLERFLKKIISKNKTPVSLILTGNTSYNVVVDESALTLILKNLLENSAQHASSSSQIKITLAEQSHTISLRYEDFGPFFTGNLKKLGTLFYKYNSPKGSGIGLYLIKNLTLNMHGQFKITSAPHLIFELSFPKSTGDILE